MSVLVFVRQKRREASGLSRAFRDLLPQFGHKKLNSSAKSGRFLRSV